MTREDIERLMDVCGKNSEGWDSTLSRSHLSRSINPLCCIIFTFSRFITRAEFLGEHSFSFSYPSKGWVRYKAPSIYVFFLNKNGQRQTRCTRTHTKLLPKLFSRRQGDKSETHRLCPGTEVCMQLERQCWVREIIWEKVKNPKKSKRQNYAVSLQVKPL